MLLALIRLRARPPRRRDERHCRLHPGLRCIVGRYRDILDPDDAWSGLAESLTRRSQPLTLSGGAASSPTGCCATLRTICDAQTRVSGRGAIMSDSRRSCRLRSRWSRRRCGHRPAGRHLRVDAGRHGTDRATRVAGLTLTDAARLLGLSYEAARSDANVPRQRGSPPPTSDCGCPRTATTLRRGITIPQRGFCRIEHHGRRRCWSRRTASVRRAPVTS